MNEKNKKYNIEIEDESTSEARIFDLVKSGLTSIEPDREQTYAFFKEISPEETPSPWLVRSPFLQKTNLNQSGAWYLTRIVAPVFVFLMIIVGVHHYTNTTQIAQNISDPFTTEDIAALALNEDVLMNDADYSYVENEINNAHDTPLLYDTSYDEII